MNPLWDVSRVCYYFPFIRLLETWSIGGVHIVIVTSLYHYHLLWSTVNCSSWKGLFHLHKKTGAVHLVMGVCFSKLNKIIRSILTIFILLFYHIHGQSPYIINCIGEDSCKSRFLSCQSGVPCIVTCSGKASCIDTTIMGSQSTDLIVTCNQEDAC